MLADEQRDPAPSAVRGRTLILGVEDELPLVFDLALSARQGGRKRPIDRYAASQRLRPDSDKARVLDAVLAARFPRRWF